MSQLSTHSHTDARCAINAMREECDKHGMRDVLTVADAHGELLGLQRLDSAPVSWIQIAVNRYA